MKHRILFIDTVHPALRERLESIGAECVDGSTWSRAQVIGAIAGFTGVVIRSRFKIDSEFITYCKNLKFIARAGAGMENIDTVAASQSGIICINAPEGNRNAVAEHALGMLLSLMNNLITSHEEIKLGIWKREENRGFEIEGKTVGIIGFGNTGSSLAKKLYGFECNILAHDPYIKIDNASYPYVKQAKMPEIFEQCDILSFHVPLTEETLYMVNSTFLNSFKKPVWLINTSRGKILKTSALAEGLKSGKVRGAALDVLEYESISFESLNANQMPDEFRFLLQCKNVILTSHIAGWTYESHRKISEILGEKICQLDL